MGIGEWLMLITLSILWGCSFFFTEIAITELPPFTIVLIRVVLAASILWGLVGLLGLQIPPMKQVWKVFLIMGLINNAIPFSLIVWGQVHIASGLAAILNATTPFFAVLIAGFFLTDERITANKLLGVGIGILGVVMMIGPEVLLGIGEHVLAQFAILGAALAYASAGVFGRRLKHMGLNPLVAAAGQVSASVLILTPITLYVDEPLQLSIPSSNVIAALFGLAVLSTVIAYFLYFKILASAGATNVLLVTLLIPVSAILLGALVLQETLHAIHFYGMALIGLGLVVLDGRLWMRLRHRTSSL